MSEAVTLARPYARAVLALAADRSAREVWSQRLQVLAQIAADPAMRASVRSPNVGDEVVVDVVGQLMGDLLGAEGSNFVRLLLENERFLLLREIAAIYESLRAEVEGRIDVTVTSAVPIADEQLRQLAMELRRRLQRDVQLSTTVDESLLGGAIVRAGDLVIDGSVAGELQKLSHALVH